MLDIEDHRLGKVNEDCADTAAEGAKKVYDESFNGEFASLLCTWMSV